MAAAKAVSLWTLLFAALVCSASAEFTGQAGGQIVLKALPETGVSARKLLRARGPAIALTINWTLRAPTTRYVLAGSIVKFAWPQQGGLGYGYGMCNFRAVIARSPKAGSVLVKIPRGSTWFGDPFSNHCWKQRQAVRIIGF